MGLHIDPSRLRPREGRQLTHFAGRARVGVWGPSSCHPSCHPSGKQVSFQIRGRSNNLHQTCWLQVQTVMDAEPFTRGFHLSSRGIPRDCTVVIKSLGIVLVSRVLLNMVPIITVILFMRTLIGRPIRKSKRPTSRPLRPNANPIRA